MAKKKKDVAELPKRMDYALIQPKDERAQLIKMSKEEPHNLDIGEVVAKGSIESVMAAAHLIAPGNWRLEKCITPNFQIGYHHMYVEFDGDKMICAFCKEN